MRALSSRWILPAAAGPVGRTLATAACLWSAVLLGTGCGGPPGGTDGAPAEPPRWRIADGVPPGESGLLLNCPSPTRCRIRFESTNGPTDATPWRTLVAGQTVLVRWSHERLPSSPHLEGQAPPDEARAGRTRPIAVELGCMFDDRASNSRRIVFWARPAHAAVKALRALPPGRSEPLPQEGSIELLTVAQTDIADGAITLKTRGLQTRVLYPETLTEADRVEVTRVFLDLAPPEGE